MESHGVEKKLIQLLSEVNGNGTAAVRIGNGLGEWFATNTERHEAR